VCSEHERLLDVGRLGRTGDEGPARWESLVQCRFHQPVRIGRELSAVAQLVKQTRRLMTSEVEVRQGEALCFTGTFRFAIMDRAGAERMMGIQLPEAWARFGR